MTTVEVASSSVTAGRAPGYSSSSPQSNLAYSVSPSERDLQDYLDYRTAIQTKKLFQMKGRSAFVSLSQYRLKSGSRV